MKKTYKEFRAETPRGRLAVGRSVYIGRQRHIIAGATKDSVIVTSPKTGSRRFIKKSTIKGRTKGMVRAVAEGVNLGAMEKHHTHVFMSKGLKSREDIELAHSYLRRGNSHDMAVKMVRAKKAGANPHSVEKKPVWEGEVIDARKKFIKRPVRAMSEFDPELMDGQFDHHDLKRKAEEHGAVSHIRRNTKTSVVHQHVFPSVNHMKAFARAGAPYIQVYHLDHNNEGTQVEE